jgi:molecular chaperone GrpE
VRDSERISEKHLEELLPLADSFEIAMKDPVWKSVDEKWRLGVEGIYSQLMTIFKNNDLTVFNPLGEEFDPREHEALIDTGTDNIIGEVIQSGYKRGEKVVRPAKVAVGTKKK